MADFINKLADSAYPAVIGRLAIGRRPPAVYRVRGYPHVPAERIRELNDNDLLYMIFGVAT